MAPMTQPLGKAHCVRPVARPMAARPIAPPVRLSVRLCSHQTAVLPQQCGRAHGDNERATAASSLRSALAGVAVAGSLLLGTPCMASAETQTASRIPENVATLSQEAPVIKSNWLPQDDTTDALLNLMLKAADQLSKSAGSLLLLNVAEAKAEELQNSGNVVDVALKMSEDALTLAQEAGELASLDGVSVAERELAVAIQEAAKLVSSVAHDLAMTEQIAAGKL